MEIIVSAANPTVKMMRSLRQKKARMENHSFLVEGIHHVGEAIQGGWEIKTLAYAPELLISAFGKELIENAKRIGTRLLPVSEQVMESLADKENPQGILAEVAQKDSTPAQIKNFKSAIALVSPQDPGNVGAILRTVDAVGADALFLLNGGVDLYHPTVIRASMGAIFWKPVIQTEFDDFLTWSREKNCQLIGTSAHADVEYKTLAPKNPWALLLGSEQKGLSREHLNACDVTVSLPMRGRVSSLNLAVAAGTLLYQFCN